MSRTGRAILLVFLQFTWLAWGAKLSGEAQERLPPKGVSSDKRFENSIDEKVTLIAVGDLSFSRNVEKTIEEKGDASYPLLKMRDYLLSGDLVFGNLESPITEGPRIPSGEWRFRSDPSTAGALKKSGFTVLSLANNHALDFGIKGLRDTFGYLSQAGIAYTGAGRDEEAALRPLYKKVKGLRFAFLAFSDSRFVPPLSEAGEKRAGIAFMRVQKMQRAVKKARGGADFVIVSMHAGIEYKRTPDAVQSRFARAAVDAGADLVLGHHPHVVQTMERYKGKYIFYSLGNFVFDQPWEETRRGLAVKVDFNRDGISRISLLPIFMEVFTQPRPERGASGERTLKRLQFPLKEDPLFSLPEATPHDNR